MTATDRSGQRRTPWRILDATAEETRLPLLRLQAVPALRYRRLRRICPDIHNKSGNAMTGNNSHMSGEFRTSSTRIASPSNTLKTATTTNCRRLKII